MTSPHIFLSHASEDTEDAREFARLLRAAGGDVWLDVDCLRPGSPWQDQIEKALESADDVVVYIGCSRVKGWFAFEVGTAIDNAVKTEGGVRVVPVCGPGADPDLLSPFLRQFQWIDARSGLAAALPQLLGLLVLAPEQRERWLPLGVSPFPGLKPFDIEDAHLFFGRRKEVADLVNLLGHAQFLAIVGDSGSGKSSLVRAGLVPALYSGRARMPDGSLPIWRVAVCRPGANPWAALSAALPELAPDLQPPQRLATIARCRERLAQGARGLVGCVEALVPQGRRTLVVVDQFEELFTHGCDDRERRRFIDSLLNAAAGTAARAIHVVITLRADFYARCFEHEALPQRMARSQYALGRMGRAQLLQAIKQPVEWARGAFEAGLVDAILSELGDQPGSLPLLAHALRQLWDAAPGGRLTHALYDGIGRVPGALSRHADDAYARLETDQERRIARRILLHLTRLGDDTEDTRRRTAKAEILTVGGDQHMVEHVLSQLVDERLLTVVAPPGAGTGAVATVEIAHEALIRHWTRLKEWLLDERDDLRTAQRLTTAAQEWLDASRDADRLYRGSQLDQALEWAQRQPEDLTSEVREFLSAGKTAREDERRRLEGEQQERLEGAQREAEQSRWLAEAEAAKRKIEQSRAEAEAARRKVEQERADESIASATKLRKRAVLLSILLVVAVGLLGVAITLATYSTRAERRAEAARASARARELAAHSAASLPASPQRALLLAIEAVHEAGDAPIVQEALRSALAQVGGALAAAHGAEVEESVPSADGAWLATRNMDGSADLWRLAAGTTVVASTRLPVVGHVRCLAFSADGQQIAAGMDGGGITVWDLAGGEPRRVAAFSLRAAAQALVLAASVLVAVDVSGEVAAWRLTSTHAPIARWTRGAGHGDTPLLALALSSDSRWVAIGGLDGLRLADLLSSVPDLAHVFPAGEARAVMDVAFDAQGRTLGFCGADGLLGLVDLKPASRRVPRLLRGHGDAVTRCRLSADGRRLASGGLDGSVVLRDLAAGESRILQQQQAPVRALAFSRDGQRLAVGDADKTIRVWTLLDDGRSRDAPMALKGHEGAIRAVVFSGDGSRLVSTAWRDQAREWNLAAGGSTAQPFVLQAAEPDVLASGTRVEPTPDGAILRFSADSNRLEVNAPGQAPRLWRLRTAPAVPVPVALPARAADTQVATLSPDVCWLASGDAHGAVWLRDLSGGRVGDIPLVEHEAPVTAVAWDSGGRWLASGAADGTLRLADLRRDVTSAAVVALEPQNDAVEKLLFSPDGRWLLPLQRSTASARSDLSPVRLWPLEAEHPQRSALLLALSAQPIVDASFSADGRWLALSTAEHRVRLWDLAQLPPRERAALPLGAEAGHVVFSPDKRWLSVSDREQPLVYLRDLHSKNLDLFTLSQPAAGRVFGLTFSADGRWLVATHETAADGASTLQIWPIDDQRGSPRALRGQRSALTVVAMSPDDRWLVAASDSRDEPPAFLSGLDGGAFTASPVALTGQPTRVAALSFSPDGRWLATLDRGNTVRLWSVDLEGLVALACRAAGRSLSDSEWERYLGDRPYRRTCRDAPGDGERN